MAIDEAKAKELFLDKMERFICLVGKKLPDDVVEKLQELAAQETVPLAKTIYETIAENQSLAEELDRPCCQDTDRKSTRVNSSHACLSRMPSSA